MGKKLHYGDYFFQLWPMAHDHGSFKTLKTSNHEEKLP